MPVLSQPNNKLTVNAGNSSPYSNWRSGGEFQERIVTISQQDSFTLSDIRLEKVITIRKLLAEGRCDRDKRLDEILAQLIKSL